MRVLVGLFLFVWYVAGLAWLFMAGHWVWGLIGIVIPLIPYVYAVIHLVS